MTREEKAIMYFKDMRKKFCEDYLLGIPKDSVAYKATMVEKEFYDTAIETLEQEPCEDAISRQAVLDKIRAEIIEKYWDCDICKWKNGHYNIRGDISDILQIIDKYRNEVIDNV